MTTSQHLPLLLILSSILPLAAGPFLAQWADRAAAAKSAVDAFTAVSLGGIVILHIWPHAFLTAGAWTLVGGLLGLLLPFLLHGSLHSHERKIYPGFVILAFLGLAVHAILDGVALFSPLAEESATALADHDADDHHGQGSALLLAFAVILHRLPMGLAVWWFAVPMLGRKFAISLLVAIGGATILGFSVAGQLLVAISMPGIAVFEATIAGMLLHVVMGHDHGHAEQPSHGTVPWASALGTLLGAALVVGLFEVHPMEQRLSEALSFGETFMGLAYTLAPWLVVALVVTAAWRVSVGPWLEASLLRDGRFQSVRWLWERLGSQGRFEISPVAILTSICLMGGGWTAWRWLGIVWILAMGWWAQRHTQHQKEVVHDHGSMWQRCISHLQREGHHIVVWAFLGVSLVALMEPMVSLDLNLDGLSPFLGFLVAAVAGAVFYRNALHGGILAFFFLHTGWTVTTVMVFLFAGSLAKVLWSLEKGSLKTPRGVAFTAVSVIGLAVLLGLLGPGQDFVPPPADLSGWFDGASTPLAKASLALLLGVLLLTLFRRGFRGLLHPIFDPAEAIEISTAPAHSPTHGNDTGH